MSSQKAVVVENLSWKYSGQDDFAIQDVNLEIEENAFVGVVGPSESGKTTLVSCIKGLIPENFHGVWRGSVQVFGGDVREKTNVTLAREMGFVFADPEAQFTSMTVEEELVFGLENIGLPVAEIEDRLNWAAETTMITDLMDKPPYEISGGQKQRVAIASVLAMKPGIIILDEPTSMLDPIGKEFIFEILLKLKQEQDLTLIVVEHNIEQIAPLADLMVLMNEGRLVKAAPPAEFFSNLGDPEIVGIRPPHVTMLLDRLGREGMAAGPLPVRLEDGVKAVRTVLGESG